MNFAGTSFSTATVDYTITLRVPVPGILGVIEIFRYFAGVAFTQFASVGAEEVPVSRDSKRASISGFS